MAKAGKLYKKDLLGQASYLPMLFLYISSLLLFISGVQSHFTVRVLLLGLIFQIITWAIQIISSAIHTLIFKNKSRRNYLIFSTVYSITLFLTAEAINSFWGNFYIIIFIFIIPLITSSWYYFNTIKGFLKHKNKDSLSNSLGEYEPEILDN